MILAEERSLAYASNCLPALLLSDHLNNDLN
jgi:hypothetical protein